MPVTYEKRDHIDLYRFAMLELTEDKAEGHKAWREKRRPTFKGR